jgi:hypothetical protein
MHSVTPYLGEGGTLKANSHMPCRASAILRQCRVLRESPRGSPIVYRIGKGKAIPLQALTGPEGSRRLRLPDFMTIGT